MSKEFGLGGLGNIFKQAQQLQERLGEVQASAASKTVEASVGGGMVTATVNGKLQVVALHIEQVALEGGDPEMLTDLIIAAVNQGIRSAQELVADEMKQLTGGIKIPGLTP